MRDWQGATILDAADARPASTRRRILIVARELLREQSFAEFRIERVAARAGLTRRTVYNQFEDRQALYRASRLELLEAFEFDLPAEVALGPDPPASVESFFRDALRLFVGAEHVELQASLARDGAALPWLRKLYQLRVERPLRLALESWLLSTGGAIAAAAARQLACAGVEMLKSAASSPAQPAFTCRELALVFLDRAGPGACHTAAPAARLVAAPSASQARTG